MYSIVMKTSTALLTLLLILAGCTTLPTRFTPSGRNSTFTFDASQPFASYIAHCRQIILAARTDLDGADREVTLAANLPFELKPDPTAFPAAADGRYHQGIILIHGLSDSPYLMQALGEHFRSRGFLVRAILLPGHGTRPGDLTRVREEDWRRALEYAVMDTRPLTEQLYLAGFSTGGALAVDYALEHPDSLSALLLFAPCLQVKSSGARWASLVGLFRTWLDINDDRDFAKYESFPVNAVVQIVALTERIGRLAKIYPERLTLPVFLALSAEDETVASDHTVDFFQSRLTNPASRLLWYSGEHQPPLFPDARITVVGSFLPGRKILSLSHLALTLPADNPHYGSQGDYRSCLHYPVVSTEYADCTAGHAAWLGEKTPDNLKTGLLQRLTWNPRFTLQNNELDRFLLSLSPPPPATDTTKAPVTSSVVGAEGRCICSAGL
ncbi:MAG: alpha/beta fold hydrolase [Desulfobulbaceae bacterium]|nr:alpha/beta fold hydrolase [Desulfobulbaceae bacterium]